MQRAPLTSEEILSLLFAEHVEKKQSVEKAAMKGDLESVKKFIENGGNVNSNFNSVCKYTLLHHASNYGHKHIVEYLLTCPGIKPMTLDVDGATALHLAALNSHPEIVQILCEFTNNQGINSKTRYGSTPLHMAIDRTNNPDEIARSNAVMDYLLHIPGIMVDITTCEGETPLTLAKKYCRPDLMEKLIKLATVQSKLSLKAISPGTNEIMISFDNNKGITDQFWKEVVVPNLTAAFNNNPESLYIISVSIDTSISIERQGFSYVAYLQRKDGKDLDIKNEKDFRLIAIDLTVQLAKKTDIEIKEFCERYLKFDIYPYKSFREKSAFQAFLVPILISFARQTNALPIELWLKIFSYCNDVINDIEKVTIAFNTGLRNIINNDGGKSLVSFYSSVGGNFARAVQLSIFSRTAPEKIEKLQEWAQENQGSAADKTLTHYLLK